MRLEFGPQRLTFATGKVKHNDNGSVILYLSASDGKVAGDLYLSPAEVRKIRANERRIIETRKGD